MRFKLVIVMFLIVPLVGISQSTKLDTIRVFYLGGQSNMDGHGYNKDLSKSQQKAMKDVYIFHGNPVDDAQPNGGLGKWEVLKPGHGVRFSSDGKNNKLSDRFGVELSFSKKMQELYPNQKIAIIKYSRGGSSIHLKGSKGKTWDPDYIGVGGNQYDYYLKTINTAFSVKDINNDGKEDYLLPSGIVWMQGESDAKNEEIANEYYGNLVRLMGLIRASLRIDDLPVVIGKISDSGNNEQGKVWNCGELIQYAQEKYAKTDTNAAIIRSTKNYNYTDKWHYNSEGYIDFGEKFAEAMYILLQK
ncbi:sialate O-acetylesterase [Lutibacter citreus]|uniref:sialate O-acetylesterase n=1 Tax=Lutibacter citreus TaxID=2138210 RepID=UPI000DBE6B3B|nr:sialate O-acetylesterase [Lutibacter citreus]